MYTHQCHNVTYIMDLSGLLPNDVAANTVDLRIDSGCSKVLFTCLHDMTFSSFQAPQAASYLCNHCTAIK